MTEVEFCVKVKETLTGKKLIGGELVFPYTEGGKAEFSFIVPNEPIKIPLHPRSIKQLNSVIFCC